MLYSFQTDNIIRSSNSLCFPFDPYKEEKQPLGENAVLQNKNWSNAFVQKGDGKKKYPKQPWNTFKVGEVSKEKKEINDEIEQSPRKACFRVHIVKK